MNLHEYQAKKLFAEYALPVSKGYTVESVEEAFVAIDKIPGNAWVVKAQVHAGGRGKAGGVKLVKTKEEAASFVKKMIGSKLVTFQTDADGQPVNKVLIESCTDIAKELYLSAVVDRTQQCIVFMCSPEGGLVINHSGIPITDHSKLLTHTQTLTTRKMHNIWGRQGLHMVKGHKRCDMVKVHLLHTLKLCKHNRIFPSMWGSLRTPNYST